MAKQDNLDPQTRDLVRFAAAIAQGYEPELRERVGPLRSSQVPVPWVEELILQSVLMCGYPRALVAFMVWRKFSGVPAPQDDAEGRYDKLRASIIERDMAIAGSINPMLSQHGSISAARQYSGRAVEAGWRCPYSGRSDRDAA